MYFKKSGCEVWLWIMQIWFSYFSLNSKLHFLFFSPSQDKDTQRINIKLHWVPFSIFLLSSFRESLNYHFKCVLHSLPIYLVITIHLVITKWRTKQNWRRILSFSMTLSLWYFVFHCITIHYQMLWKYTRKINCFTAQHLAHGPPHPLGITTYKLVGKVYNCQCCPFADLLELVNLPLIPILC